MNAYFLFLSQCMFLICVYAGFKTQSVYFRIIIIIFKIMYVFISIGYFLVDIMTSGYISFLVGAVVFDCDIVEEYSIVCYLKCIFLIHLTVYSGEYLL